MKTVQARLHKTGGKTSEAFHVRVPRTPEGEVPDIVKRDGVLYLHDIDDGRTDPYEYFEVVQWVHEVQS